MSPKRRSVATPLALAIALSCAIAPAARADRGRVLPCQRRVPVAVEYVVDGDTVHVRFRGKKLKVRLLGLDAPELRDERPAVRALAARARDRLRGLIDAAGGEAELRTTRRRSRCFFRDAYERTLARLFLRIDGRPRDAGRRLVRERLACKRRVRSGCDPR